MAAEVNEVVQMRFPQRLVFSSVHPISKIFCIDSMKSAYDPNCLEDVRNCGAQEETKLIHV